MPKKICKVSTRQSLLPLGADAGEDDCVPRHIAQKLVSCKYCKRTFFPDRVGIHEGICQKTHGQPNREVYDSTKFRLTGTVAEPFIEQIKAEDFSKPSHLWKAGDEEFKTELEQIKAKMRAAMFKAASPCVPNLFRLESYVQCPICGRRFSNDAGKRHIPNCRNYCRKVVEDPPAPSPPKILRRPSRSRQSKLNLAENILRFHQKHNRLC